MEEGTPNAHLPHTGSMDLRMTMLEPLSPQTTEGSPTSLSQFSNSMKFQKPSANRRKHVTSGWFHHPAGPCLNPSLHGEFLKSSLPSTCSCFLGYHKECHSTVKFPQCPSLFILFFYQDSSASDFHLCYLITLIKPLHEWVTVIIKSAPNAEFQNGGGNEAIWTNSRPRFEVNHEQEPINRLAAKWHSATQIEISY